MLATGANLLPQDCWRLQYSTMSSFIRCGLSGNTPQNIVIAGPQVPCSVIGWVAATGALALEPVLMFALIFLWTPPHFWALSLFMHDDYARARIPMLTVVRGETVTRRYILGYTCALVPVSLMMALGSVGGPMSLSLAIVMNGVFLLGAVNLVRRTDVEATGDRTVRRKFQVLLCIVLIFAGLIADVFLRPLASSWLPLF